MGKRGPLWIQWVSLVILIVTGVMTLIPMNELPGNPGHKISLVQMFLPNLQGAPANIMILAIPFLPGFIYACLLLFGKYRARYMMGVVLMVVTMVLVVMLKQMIGILMGFGIVMMALVDTDTGFTGTAGTVIIGLLLILVLLAVLGFLKSPAKPSNGKTVEKEKEA